MDTQNKTAGKVEVCCPDERCRWSYITSPENADEAIRKHLVVDARHTNGSWIDRDGRERVGMEYADESEQ